MPTAKKTAKKTSAEKTSAKKTSATKTSASMNAVSPQHRAAFHALRAAALAFPEAWEEHPWGESAIKVKAKVFVVMFCGVHSLTSNHLSLSLKLPVSGPPLLALPFASPTGYGLGKSGWATFGFGKEDVVPTDVLSPLLAESYCAVAPKTLAKAVAPPPPSTRGRTRS